MNYKNKLICKNLTKHFILNNQPTCILSAINYQFFSDTNYAIMGNSGSGKSTLMHLLAGFDTPTTGTLFYNQTPFDTLSIEKRTELLGFLIQNPTLIAECTVLENCCLPLIIKGESWDNAQKKALHFLSLLNLSFTANWEIGQLSGGQKQRIALIRTLLIKPQFLLADELTGNLDQETGQAIITFLINYSKQNNIGLILSTHDPEVAAKMDVVLLLKDGKLMQQTQGAFHEQKHTTQKNI